MEYDYEAAKSKRNELLEAAAAPSNTLPTEVLESVLRAFSQVTPPREPEVTIGLVTISSLYSTPKAESRKPGNVVLNWRKLIDIVPDISLAGLGAATLPLSPAIAWVLAGLYIWNKLRHGTLEEFSDIEAVTLLALWQNRNLNNKIDEQQGFAKVNEVRASYSQPPLSQGQYAAAVDRLVKIRCVELDSGVVWLREWIRIAY